MTAIRLTLRLCFDMLPALALAVCALMLASQSAHARPDAVLQQVLFVGTVMELLAAMFDGLLADALGKPLHERVIHWLAVHVLFGGAVVGIVVHARLDPVAWLLIAAFVVPRFLTFVAMPPRDERERRRIKALARDRFESVFVAITAIPLFAIAAVFIGSMLPVHPELVIVPVALGLLASWLLLVASAAAVAAAPGFARRPQRLLTRGWWPRLVHPFPRLVRAANEDWRAEEALWLRDPAP